MTDLDRFLELYERTFDPVDRPPSRSARARKVASHLKQTLQATRRYGGTVRDVAGVPVPKQLAGQLAMRARYGLGPDSFYRYRLYEARHRRDAKGYLRGVVDARMRDLVLAQLGADTSALDDKAKFFHVCRESGVPTIEVLASFAGGRVTWHSADGRLPARDLFTKPAQADGGEGVQLWTCESGTYATEGDGPLTADALVGRLAEWSRSSDWLVQPRLRDHPDLARLSSGGLCTVRVVTAMEGPESGPDVLVTVLRMAASSTTVDNFGEGGLAAPVDPATGVLGPAVRKDIAEAAVDVSVHPATGHRIEGARVPHWDEVLALARRAHRAFPGLLVIGWDIAVTTEGVVVVEGNAKPGSNLSQQPGSRPLGLTALPGIYLRALQSRAGPT